MYRSSSCWIDQQNYSNTIATIKFNKTIKRVTVLKLKSQWKQKKKNGSYHSSFLFFHFFFQTHFQVFVFSFFFSIFFPTVTGSACIFFSVFNFFFFYLVNCSFSAVYSFAFLLHPYSFWSWVLFLFLSFFLSFLLVACFWSWVLFLHFLSSLFLLGVPHFFSCFRSWVFFLFLLIILRFLFLLPSPERIDRNWFLCS